jgi:hypothetical protein
MQLFEYGAKSISFDWKLRYLIEVSSGDLVNLNDSDQSSRSELVRRFAGGAGRG